MRIIMWTLKLLDTERCTTKVLQAGVQLALYKMVDCFNKSVSDCYIRVYRSFWQGTANFWLGLLLATPLKRGTQLIFKIYLHDHARQLEYSKHVQYRNLLQIFFYFSSLSISKQTSSMLLPKIIYGQVHVSFTIDNIVSMVTYPIRRNKLLKMHDRQSQK